MRNCNEVIAAAAAVLTVSLPATAMAHPGHAAPSAPAAHAWMHALPWVLVVAAAGLVAWRWFGASAERNPAQVRTRDDQR